MKQIKITYYIVYFEIYISNPQYVIVIKKKLKYYRKYKHLKQF